MRKDYFIVKESEYGIMKRESFQSRLGFLLVSAGCAVGIGNVWKFPYVAGQNGGGVFVLFYLLFLLIMGVPVLTMELAVGRASRKSAVLGYQALEPAGSKWHWHGWFCVAGCYLLMMYYTTVSGWMLGYFYKFASGQFVGLEGEQVSEQFGVQLWLAKGLGANYQSDDVGPFGVDCGAGGAQPVATWRG